MLETKRQKKRIAFAPGLCGGPQRFFAHFLATVALVAAGCGDNLTPVPERGMYQGPQPVVLSCVPNLDGRIDAREMTPNLGAQIQYLINPSGQLQNVNIGGLVDEGGVRVWDMSQNRASDQILRVGATGLATHWFAAFFAGGQFVTALDASGQLQGVYSHSEEGISLHGYASREENPASGKTLVVYESPVAIYRFPVASGQEFVSVGVVRNATLLGLPYAGKDTYRTRVDAAGELWLPELRFAQAHRVRTDVIVEPAVGQSVQRKQVSWLFECFGEVARATSQNGESQDNFTTAVEIRRLGLP